MKCEECKKSILLYEELTPAERSETDAHLSTCTACSIHFELWRKQTMMIREAASFEHMPCDSDRITMKVMASVRQQSEQRKIWWHDWAFRIESPVRFAMGIISLTLVVFFVVELQEAGNYTLPVSVTQQTSDGDLILDTRGFIKEYPLQNRKAVEQTSFYACFQECRESINEYDCDQCKIQISKWIRKI